MDIKEVISALELAESEAVTSRHAEILAGNVVKQAHAEGELCGLRHALALLRISKSQT